MSIIVDDHESESGKKFLQALRILLTPPESYYGMILDCDIKSLLIFVVLQGEFQDKLNKLESESVNEGRSSHLGQFLNFQFTTELAP